MRNISFFIFSFLLTITFGCDFINRKDVNNKAQEQWQRLTIRSEGSTLATFVNDNDSATFSIYPIVSIFSPKPTHKIKPSRPNIFKVYFTRAEKDSIFNLAKDLIMNPAKTKGACTEYIGHLELIIDYQQFRQYGEYTSVCDWSKLSDKTIQLHNILKRKKKDIYWGGSTDPR